MSEAERTPLIELSVDQEVFIEVIRDGDSVDDATVATEVTSFERVGDAYVLEGAIVFAGYLARNERMADPERDVNVGLAFEFENEEFAQHVHHRMPFVLRVPVKSQQRGIVNVASRITSWHLEVIGAGWMRVVAQLNIIGLNGNQGYHFQCGAQEDGDLFFHRDWNLFDAVGTQSESVSSEGPEVEATSADLDVTETQTELTPRAAEGTPVEESFVPEASEFSDVQFAAGGTNPAADVQAAAHHSFSPNPDEFVPEAVSRARGGQDVAGEEEAEASAANGVTFRNDLADFDRVLNGPAEIVQEDVPTALGAGSQVARSMPLTSSKDDSETLAEFEFQHQVSPEDEAVAAPVRGDEQFVPSRSFGEDGFHATAGFAPMVTVGARAVETESVASESAEVAQEEASRTQVGAGGTAGIDSGLWTFVDFNAPEPSYTLRYVIVDEGESVELVAERLGCAKADLMRVNKLTGEVLPGQTLLVPHAAVRAVG